MDMRKIAFSCPMILLLTSLSAVCAQENAGMLLFVNPLGACPDPTDPAEIARFKTVPLGPTRVAKLGEIVLAGSPAYLERSASPQSIVEMSGAWSRLLIGSGRILNRLAPITYSVCFSATADKSRFIYMPAISVARLDRLPENFGGLTLPPQTYLVATFTGPASEIANFRYSMVSEYWPTSIYHRINAPNIEVYKPGYDPMSATSSMELWVAIEPPK
jgi:predicted transcriptional regulator YdeE